jgi:cell division protein FtsI (penicillin-binding protein 3)
MMCFVLTLAVVVVRLVQLQGLESSRFRAEAQHYRLNVSSVPAIRGSIVSADGTPLAMTSQTDTVTADPPQIPDQAQRQQVAALLAGPLHQPAAVILDHLNHHVSKDYALLGQGVPVTVGNRIAAELAKRQLPGITVQSSYVRAYPGGALASNLVGFTTAGINGDLQGQAGIEQSFNSLLAGRDGQDAVETSTTGQAIPGATDRIKPMVPGGSVRLTILANLQWAAQQACADQVRASRADSCTAVVMQPGTGRILALAQAPGYDPSHVTDLNSTADLPVSAVFEPGSTAKTIAVAAALERGGQAISSAYTVPSQIVVDGFPFRDAEQHATERLTVAGILAHSSNVGMVQLIQHITPQVQYQYLRAFGLGSATGLPLPAESEGILAPPSKWWGDQRYTLSFGQGVSATAVQMASVYATIANGGVRVQPTLVAGTTSAAGRFTPAPAPARHRVIKTSTAHELISILQQVPYLDATVAYEPWGEIPGYSVASKTGTAQEGVNLSQYGSSYIGMAPASDPQLVVAVNVQNPRRGGYYGNMVAGPVFYRVMKFALQTLKIPPDGGKRPYVSLTAP